MFLKEYRYILDGEEKVLYAVVTYGGAEVNYNIVNVFISQDVCSAKQFNRVNCGYEQVENNGGYYINSVMENGKMTVDYLNEFMDCFVSSMTVGEVKKVVCPNCGKDEIEVTLGDKIWCKECYSMEEPKILKLR